MKNLNCEPFYETFRWGLNCLDIFSILSIVRLKNCQNDIEHIVKKWRLGLKWREAVFFLSLDRIQIRE